MLAQLVATFCAALFAAVAYRAAAHHPLFTLPTRRRATSNGAPSHDASDALLEVDAAPSRMALGRARWLMAWQSLLAVMGVTASLYAWRTGAGAGWLIGSLGLGLVIPITLIAMSDASWSIPKEEEDTDMALERLLRWAEIHAMRSLAGGFSFVTFLLMLSDR